MFINNFLSDSTEKLSDPYSLNLLSSKSFNPISFATNHMSYQGILSIGDNVGESNLFLLRCLDTSYRADNRPSPERVDLINWMSIDDVLTGTPIKEWLKTAKRYIEKYPEVGGNNHSRDAHMHIKEVTDLLCQTSF